jgi:hypothetical protein
MKKKKEKQQSALLDDLSAIIEQMKGVYGQAGTAYTPLVDDIILNKSKDRKQIEYVLDHLLDFAGNERMLNLFRKLCRYYLPINPEAVANYIKFYKEMYDEDEALFKSEYFRKHPIK